MTKGELAYCISELDRIHDDYYFAFETYKNGRKRESREIASNKMDMAKSVAKNLFDSYPELWDFVEYPDEFFAYQHFLGDLQLLISKLKSEQLNQQ